MGYQKANLVANGQMQASPFVTIGTNGVFLSDLSVTGDPIESEGGCWANVSIAMLTGTGFNQYVGDMIKTYYWYEEDGVFEAGWYDESEHPLANNASPLGNANEIYFDQGEAMWLNVDAEYAGCKIDYKGGVFNASFAYPLVANGQMVGNPYPAPVYLADITVAGNPIESEGGCWANVSIAMLTGTGFNQYVGDMIKTYYWYEEDGVFEAGWYDESEHPLANNASPLGNADEISFGIAQGIWVNVDAEYAGCTLNFAGIAID